ncbi:hypothetical protein CLG96_03380 [Sphingomonas oleivorans]|uniref:Uncharacterized protein n=1 Tax=Sphingomonas oleivorans TaxID=1735121 RepID=A0A2T5G246_9SPHN|nr:hypothetical protein CLG96_03380 [Sphingomonas oleivorans]
MARDALDQADLVFTGSAPAIALSIEGGRALAERFVTLFPLPSRIVESLAGAHSHRDGEWLFQSRSHSGEHISMRQHRRLVDEWVGRSCSECSSSPVEMVI